MSDSSPHAPSGQSSIWSTLNLLIGGALVLFVLYFGGFFVLGGIRASQRIHGPKEAATVEAPAAAPVVSTAAPVELTMKPDPTTPFGFATKEYTVKAGQLVKFTFDNNGGQVPQPHNWVLGKVGSLDALNAAAAKALADPTAIANGFIPNDPVVLAHTKLLQPGQKDSIEFTLPAVGEYPFICCFPGHNILMKGVMKAE